MTRRIIEHTADVRLRVEAASLEELFSEAMLGMFEIMSPLIRPSATFSPAGGGEGIDLEIHSPDRTSLLVDFLNEVLSRAHIRKECFGVEFDRLSETDLTATLIGTPALFEQDVKAVTYHEAEVCCENGVWSTMLVFDI